MESIESRTPAVLTSCPVDRLRVGLEDEVRAEVAAHPRFLPAGPTSPGADRARDARREALASGLPLSEATSPRLYALARRVHEVLRVGAPFELYQSAYSPTGPAGHAVWNAQMGWHDDVALVLLLGSVVRVLEPPGIAAVIGHEFGHFLAHGPRTPRGISPWTVEVLASTGSASSPRHAEDVAWLGARAAELSQAQELTADRFGLLACQDLDAVLALEIVSATGMSPAELGWEPRTYLAHCRELMESTLADASAARPAVSWAASHPEHAMRAYASWLFSESDLYRELTGHGPGTRPIGEVNATIARLLRPSSTTPPWRRTAAGPNRADAPAEGVVGGIRAALAGAAAALSEVDLGAAVRRAGADLGLLDHDDAQGAQEAVGDAAADAEAWDDPEERALLERFAELERKSIKGTTRGGGGA